jgi:hypothetical protein
MRSPRGPRRRSTAPGPWTNPGRRGYPRRRAVHGACRRIPRGSRGPQRCRVAPGPSTRTRSLRGILTKGGPKNRRGAPGMSGGSSRGLEACPGSLRGTRGRREDSTDSRGCQGHRGRREDSRTGAVKGPSGEVTGPPGPPSEASSECRSASPARRVARQRMGVSWGSHNKTRKGRAHSRLDVARSATRVGEQRIPDHLQGPGGCPAS